MAFHYRNQTRTLTLAGTQGWRLLAAPVLTSPAQLLRPTWTQGAIGADDTDGDPNVYQYTESVPGARGFGYTAVPSIDLPAEAGRGYAVYVFADDDATTPGTQGGFPKTLPAQGLTRDGRATAFPVSFTLTPCRGSREDHGAA